jgi:hypothetical protein
VVLDHGDEVTVELISSEPCASPAAVMSSNSEIMDITPAVTPSVTLSLTSGVNPGCSGQTYTFEAFPVNEGATPSYQWYVNGLPEIGETGVVGF